MKDKILQLHKEGKSYRDIQKLLGCSKGTIAYHLGVGQKDKTRQRTRDKRHKIRKLIHLAKDVACADCHEKYPYFVMQFDHLEPAKKTFELSDFRSKTHSEEKVLTEISKCEVVCANCHAIRTFYRNNFKNPDYFGWDVTDQFRS